jgi:hypothetical protein
LTEDTELSSDFGFENDTDRNAFSVEHGGSEDRLDSMTDSVAKVDEVSQTRFSLVDSDNMSLDVDRSRDDLQ